MPTENHFVYKYKHGYIHCIKQRLKWKLWGSWRMLVSRVSRQTKWGCTYLTCLAVHFCRKNQPMWIFKNRNVKCNNHQECTCARTELYLSKLVAWTLRWGSRYILMNLFHFQHFVVSSKKKTNLHLLISERNILLGNGVDEVNCE